MLLHEGVDSRKSKLSSIVADFHPLGARYVIFRAAKKPTRKDHTEAARLLGSDLRKQHVDFVFGGIFGHFSAVFFKCTHKRQILLYEKN